jgi:hypothetical protein
MSVDPLLPPHNPGSKPTEGYNWAWLEAVDQIGIENHYEHLDL